jgi:hypothetical protein
MRRILFATLATALAVAVPALAHHGWAGYLDEEFELSGQVVSAELANPHGVIKVRAQGGVWDVMLSPMPGIARAGLTKTVLPTGARVTARGHRHRDPQRLEIKTERLVVGGKTYDLYPNRN